MSGSTKLQTGSSGGSATLTNGIVQPIGKAAIQAVTNKNSSTTPASTSEYNSVLKMAKAAYNKSNPLSKNMVYDIVAKSNLNTAQQTKLLKALGIK